MLVRTIYMVRMVYVWHYFASSRHSKPLLAFSVGDNSNSKDISNFMLLTFKGSWQT